MRGLISFAQENPNLQRLVARVTEFEQTQGVVLDYDPLWLNLWHLLHRKGEAAMNYWLTRNYRRPDLYSPEHWLDDLHLSNLWDWSEEEEIISPPPDPAWAPPHWKDWCYGCGYDPSPVIVKVATNELVDHQELLGRETEGLRVVQSVRQPAYLQMPKKFHRPLQGGVSIGHGLVESGTLGGITTDQQQNYWGVTCAHVFKAGSKIDQPAQADSRLMAKAIGTNVHLSPLMPSAHTTLCNPYHSNSKMNSLDAALVEIDPAVHSLKSMLNVGRLRNIRPMSVINPGDMMDVAGKECGNRVLRVGGLALTYRFFDNQGTAYCFKDVFELRWPRNLRLLMGRPIKPGDSGAWAISSSTADWAGMVLAGDRLCGYAMFAENVAHWASQTHGLHLAVA